MSSRRSFTTLSAVLVLLIAATVSYHASPASAAPAPAPAPTATATAPSASRAQPRVLSATPLGLSGKLEEIKQYALKKLAESIGAFTSNDIVQFLWKVIKFLSGYIWFFVSDPQARVDTCLNWVVDSMLNPFKTLTDGMHSFERLFRYIHKIKKDTYAGLGADNLMYQCFKGMYPACVAQATGSVESEVLYHFYCAYLFYEKCSLHYWFKKGGWKVPDINGDICHLHPTGKCPDQPPAGQRGRW
ncbi:hypothetical protein KSP40_PGU009533 [Platanthera guangdongensis]|uniref:Uncharacterized protein n=1 Tax=Platanthera guangdongensis TaxID=2320717 RepID=A0ABR2LMM1_9ASPA